MHETVIERLEGGPTVASLAPEAAGPVPAPDRHGLGRQRGGGQPVEDAWTGGWSGSSPPPPGARCRLTAARLARLPVLLRHGPEAYGFQGQLWTCGRMAAVIRVACGVSCHPRHVGRLC